VTGGTRWFFAIRRHRRVALLFVCLAGVLGAGILGCSRGDGAQGSNAAANAHQAGGGQRGPGGDRQRPSEPPIPVAVEEARKGDISSYYTATATLEAEKEAQILARVNGVVLAIECEEGDWVKEGQALLRVEDAEYRFRVAQAAATTANLRDRCSRLEGMWKQQMVSAEEYENAKNELKSAEAAEEIARLNLSYTNVVAPFSGRVVSRLVDVGQNVSAGTSLFVISDFDPLLAVVQVPSKEFKRLQVDQRVELTLDSNKQRLHGRIKLVSPVIDPTSGTIKVTVEIHEYPAGTRPGDFAEVSIVTERRADTVLVPKIAVFTDRGEHVVFVAADSTAERRVVSPGFEDDANTEILQGMTAGEKVVVKGQRSLKHGAAVKVLEEPDSVGAAASVRAGS
jgi:membrane fusion protein (multidrug efflux system)